jgi:serine/threonine protein kinase
VGVLRSGRWTRIPGSVPTHGLDPGPTLHELGHHSLSDLHERLGYVCDLAEAVTVLHSASQDGNAMLHRDIKPANVIIDPERGAVLIDFGTMRSLTDGFDEDGMHSREYTAPEVLANPHAARTFASDLYSLGALTYFCSGKRRILASTKSVPFRVAADAQGGVVYPHLRRPLALRHPGGEGLRLDQYLPVQLRPQ